MSVPVMSMGIKSGVNWMRLKLSAHRFGETRDEQRLGEAGHAHQQRVTAGEEADGELLDDLVLADDDFFELIAEAAVNLAEFINGGDVVLRKRGVGHADFLCAHEWHQKRGVLTSVN
jgi:hypothetical protein